MACAPTGNAFYPVTSESENISFNRLNRSSDQAHTGDEVANEDIIKGCQLEKDQFNEVTKDDLEEIALETMRTIEIDEFVERS
jgi:DNA end-binding protein Ku